MKYGLFIDNKQYFRYYLNMVRKGDSYGVVFAFLLLSFTLIFSCLFGANSLAQDHSYKLRGSGNNLRKEGVDKETIGAHFMLLSVTRDMGKWQRVKPSLLAVKFFMPAQSTAYLRVREIVNVHTYKLDSINTNWPIGWNTFGPWSANEVINNLGIPIENLGISITQRATPHSSGMAYPAILTDGHQTKSTNYIYSFVVKSNTGLEPFKWGLYKLNQNRQQTRLDNQQYFIEKLVAGTPYEIKIDMSDLEEGYYKLKMRGEYITSDYNKIVRKYYIFYHKRN